VIASLEMAQMIVVESSLRISSGRDTVVHTSRGVESPRVIAVVDPVEENE
jgi:hypothetical protein